MDKMEIVTTEINGIEEVSVIIDRGNGEFTSMLKSTYEAQQVEHLTEIPTAEQSTPNPTL